MHQVVGRWTHAGSAVAHRVAGLLAMLAWLALAVGASAADKAQLLVTTEQGFGRMVLSFPERSDLPEYKVRYENGVLAVEFAEPISLLLPDVSVALPDYVSVARVDPDNRGVRFGLRTALNVNQMPAAERLFIDLLPTTWQGLPPALPEEVIADLAKRAQEAERIAEQKRKAEDARRLSPTASLRVGRNPTFVRVEFNWNVDTKAKFAVTEDTATIDFEWPVPIDLYALKADLPAEVLDVLNAVSADGSSVTLTMQPGIVPRFYTSSPSQYVLDIDISREDGLAKAIAAAEAEKAEAAAKAAAEHHEDGVEHHAEDAAATGESQDGGAITPVISTVGTTIRIAFPFDEDTAAAVFRRADTVWLLFDTSTDINQPPASDELAAIASRFEVIPAGDTEVVRIDLAADRLATLGSEGRSWVLSLGDVLLSPTEPLTLTRVRDREGRFEMQADLERPARVHQFRDPIIGDLITIVTAYPPSRGATRTLSYVDFAALRSVQGLVVKPNTEGVTVSIEGKNAVIRTEAGLVLSDVQPNKPSDADVPTTSRAGFVDLIGGRASDPPEFVRRREEIMAAAAGGEGRLRDLARMTLAELYIANQFGPEALGVITVLEDGLSSPDLAHKLGLLRAIASLVAYRPQAALDILSQPDHADEVDSIMWRTIAKTELGDYQGARLDALAAEGILDAYPSWVQARFLLASARAAIETNDVATANQMLGNVDFAKLGPEEISEFGLLQGRLAELGGQTDVALEDYGQVITADIRPTRAEAVYRTILMLNEQGRIDLAAATQTLAAESMLWRGNRLEADMSKLLAELYFRAGLYRDGFEVVQQAVAYYPENESIAELLDESQKQFISLFLDGGADRLGEVEALALYYDYQQLTPPGARGDEMIRNLARRLVKADLLTQAGDLLEYQIDNRLKGVSRSQIAADLAIIRIADRDPEAALRVLNRTRLADLSPLLERQRRVLEARALIDAGREELALDLLTRITGRDADLLRVDAYWQTKNYGRAAETIEMIFAPGQSAGVLDAAARMQVIKAAVGFVLANDRLGISRLKAKFGDVMASSAEWPVFDFVTSEISPMSDQFKKVARDVADLDTLGAFVSSYQQLYAGKDTVAPASAETTPTGG